MPTNCNAVKSRKILKIINLTAHFFSFRRANLIFQNKAEPVGRFWSLTPPRFSPPHRNYFLVTALFWGTTSVTLCKLHTQMANATITV